MGSGGGLQRDRGMIEKRSRRNRYLAIAATVVLVVAGVVTWRAVGRAKAPPPVAQVTVPVTVATAQRRDVPIFLSALGTVQALNTVSIHSQVDGKLLSVNFEQGQEVHK